MRIVFLDEGLGVDVFREYDAVFIPENLIYRFRWFDSPTALIICPEQHDSWLSRLEWISDMCMQNGFQSAALASDKTTLYIGYDLIKWGSTKRLPRRIDIYADDSYRDGESSTSMPCEPMVCLV